MLRNLLLLLFIINFTSSINAQNTTGVLTNSEDSFAGYTLFSPRTSITPRYTYLINNCGEIVNQWESSFPLFSTDYLMPDGSLFRSVVDNQSTLGIPGNTGRIEHLDWDGNLIWGLTLSDTDFSFHHDYVVLDNGNIILLIAYRMTEAEAIAEGRDPSTLAMPELYEERVIEIEPVGTDSYNTVWEWHSWDHLIQDFDDTKNNYDPNVGDHPELMDINFGVNFGEADWWHSNALSYNADLDQIIISNRNQNEFLIIDHSTTTQEAASDSGGNSGMGGNILYRWGNPISYRQGDASDQILYGQHNVQFIPNGLPNAGKIMIFNNGNGINYTRIQVIDAPYNSTTQNYPFTGTAYGPTTIDWEYQDPDDQTNFYAAFLSGSQQLPNGNVLICHGPNGTLFEVDTNGNKVWEYQSPVGLNDILSDGDDPSFFETRIFRALRYGLDYSAFTGRDLTPIGVIEQNPVFDNCELLSISDNNLSDAIKVYPTLVDANLTIETPLLNYSVSIHNIQGQLIGNYGTTNLLNVSFLKSGMYLLKISNNASSSVIKFIKK